MTWLDSVHDLILANDSQASAIEQMLRQEQSAGVRVLVVWEPMLPTDWSRPSGLVQSRIPDSRAVQFWDKDHLVAKGLRDQFPSSQALCCERHGVLWDVAALYASGVHWGGSAPRELSYATLSRTLTLPEVVDTEKINAEYNNGLLDITAPVAAAVLQRQVEIKGLPKAKAA